MGGLERAPHAPLGGSQRPGKAVAPLEILGRILSRDHHERRTASSAGWHRSEPSREAEWDPFVLSAARRAAV